MTGTKLGVRVYLIGEPQGDTKAFASVAVDDLVAIRGIRVVDGENGPFVSMPQSKDRHGDYHDTAFPLTADLRKGITKAVLGEYSKVASLPQELRGYERSDMDAAKAENIEDVKLDIRVQLLKFPKRDTKAVASVSVNGLVAINDVRIVAGPKGLFVTMPQSRDKDKKYHDVAFPLNADLRKKITKGVLEQFHAVKPRSLGEKLAAGAEKAAAHVSPQPSAAKGSPGIGE